MNLARRPWLYFGPAALIAGGIAVAIIAASDHEAHPAIAIALGLFVSWSFILAGLIGWTRRPTICWRLTRHFHCWNPSTPTARNSSN